MKKGQKLVPSSEAVNDGDITTLIRDALTIPNAMSLAGGKLTWDGAENLEEVSGLAQVIIGRSIDVADGAVARATGQTSNVGAAVDAITDKLVTGKLLYEMYKKGAAPKSIIGTIALLNTINAAATGIANYRSKHKGETRPTTSGKLAMAGETLALFAYASAYTAEHNGKSKLAKTLRAAGRTAFVASLPPAAHASWTYIKRAIFGGNSDDTPEA
ncbi:CDP-alcohol phosphatidyltransferase family protein [Candidatus Saccharibacteria bacterium oral taxon 488]|nr:CDP-alcohol phosphatidyltransferase family protein [Candidatus Saccharibacteria bacterium oral taxon 488]